MESPVVKAFIAGSISGTCSAILFQPLDLVKTRIQTAVPIQGTRGTEMMTVMSSVVRNQNILGLWRGMIPSIARCVPGVGVYFGSLHWLKSTLLDGKPSPTQAMGLGILARSLSGVTMIPFTVVKTRFESGDYAYRGVTEALRVIYRTEGARGLCSGLAATLLRDAPFSGIYLYFYTQSKLLIPSSWLEGSWAPSTHFTCGVLAGVLASSVTQPADVIKTKMQLYPERFPTTYTTVVFVYQNSGVAGYFKGIAPRMLRRTLISAMAWTVYEQITKKIGLK